MIQFTKPKNLNGAELLDQLNAAGVSITDSPYIDENQNFWLNVKESDKVKAASIVSSHNGTMIAPEPSIDEKLSSVGLTVADLKAALAL
jgi:hypothetical protein